LRKSDKKSTKKSRGFAAEAKEEDYGSQPASKSAAVRARLNHPVIDSDGHTVEFLPAVLDYLEQTGGQRSSSGSKLAQWAAAFLGPGIVCRLKNVVSGEPAAAVVALPTKNTRDRATALSQTAL